MVRGISLSKQQLINILTRPVITEEAQFLISEFRQEVVISRRHADHQQTFIRAFRQEVYLHLRSIIHILEVNG